MTVADATFGRVSLHALFDNAPPALGWFVVSHHWVHAKKDRRRLHGAWCRISSEHATVYRVLRFSPLLKASADERMGDLAIDYPAWIALSGFQEDTNQPVRMIITKAKWWHRPLCALSHPDPSYRLSAALGLLSVFLGILSIVLSIR